MFAKRFLVLAFVLLAYSKATTVLALDQGDGVPITIFAHFCNWLGGESWNTTATIPFRGRYDSANRVVIAAQNAEMAAYGIKPLISYWGADDRRGDSYLDTYLSVPSSLQVGILLEVTGFLTPNEAQDSFDFNDSANRAELVRQLTHLDQRYFSNPRYADRFFRIDGRPVVFIWLTHAFRGPFAATIAEARKSASFYLIGSNFNITGSIGSGAREDVIPALDALSAYGLYDQNVTRATGGWLDRQYVEQYKHGVRWWSNWLLQNAPGVKLILPIQFAYNDTLVRPEADHPILMSTDEQAQMLTRSARAFMACSMSGMFPYRNIIPVALVVSYNEHFEGTAIEPGTTVGLSPPYGYNYMQALHDILGPPMLLPGEVTAQGCNDFVRDSLP